MERDLNVCIIPARGGSKRIPKKNIKFFLGKPIIAYSIEAALDSGLFDKVVVSTDSKEIAQVAEKYSAEVPFVRPKEISDDYTGTNDVVKHALNWYIKQDIVFDYVCCLYATAPFVGKEYLEAGLKKLHSSHNKSFAFSVTSFPFPIQRAISIDNHEISSIYPEYIKKRSQDLLEAFHDAGQFYWGRPSAFLGNDNLFSNNSVPVIIPRHLVQDIDTLEDWKRAELMYRALTLEKTERIGKLE